MDIDAEPIDAVYLWVDGSDQAFRRRLRNYRPEYPSPPGRFRDNGELRFSLRSLEQHAPWIRRVYLVTSCRLPAWINNAHPRLQVISEDTLLPEGCAPTFNSNTIEWHLRKIPGLSRRFLHLCDDFFLGRAISREDFLTTSGGQRVYLDVSRVIEPSRCAPNLYECSMVFTQRLLVQRFSHAVGKLVTHSPRLYDQSVLVKLEQTWPDEIHATSRHRFRQPDDVSLELLYHHYLLQSPTCAGMHQLVPCMNGPHYFFAMLDPRLRHTLSQLDAIAYARPKFFCLNDDLGRRLAPRTWLIRRHVRYLLDQLFSRPSCFERAAA